MVIQKLFSTGKPDGDSFNKTVSDDHTDTPIAGNSYTLNLAKGDYMIQVAQDGSTIYSSDTKVTVKGSII
jgi:hypothetical protein